MFFLYFSGRLYSTQALLETAVKQFHLAINAQKEYIQLQHICHWDLGLTSLAMGDWAQGYDCFNILNKDSNWSKAIYAYAKATTLYEQGKEKSRADEIMRDVPDLMQRIAGKSIPLEVRRPLASSRTDGGRNSLLVARRSTCTRATDSRSRASSSPTSSTVSACPPASPSLRRISTRFRSCLRICMRARIPRRGARTETSSGMVSHFRS